MGARGARLTCLAPSAFPCRGRLLPFCAASSRRPQNPSNRKAPPLARVVQLIQIDLNGASFRLELGGLVALCERTFTDDAASVAVVRVDTLQEAERLETLANALHATFRWKEGHRQATTISVEDFEKQVAAGPARFVPEAARERLGLKGPVAVAVANVQRCDCGIPLNLWGKCDVCSGVDNNFPGKHD